MGVKARQIQMRNKALCVWLAIGTSYKEYQIYISCFLYGKRVLEGTFYSCLLDSMVKCLAEI